MAMRPAHPLTTQPHLGPNSTHLRSYVPFLADIFSIVPLSLNEWALVLAYSLPVILIDEVRGWLSR